MTDVDRQHPLVAHVESHLGPIVSGRRLPSTGHAPVFVLRFDDQPHEGAVTYATLGLSDTPLHQLDNIDIRQELLVSMWATEDDEEPSALLMSVAEDVMKRAHALARGDVLGPAGPILDGASTEALYATAPVYFEDSFHVFRGSEQPTFFVWLVPITQDEARYIRNHGWDAFEDRLEADDPDLLDIRRSSIRLRG